MDAKRWRFGNDRGDGIQCGIYCARFFGPSARVFSRVFLAASEIGTRAGTATDIGASFSEVLLAVGGGTEF